MAGAAIAIFFRHFYFSPLKAKMGLCSAWLTHHDDAELCSRSGNVPVEGRVGGRAAEQTQTRNRHI